jgi:hypothetical protein
MATRQTSTAIERVWSQLPEGAREVLESELSPTDLQSLLLGLAQTRGPPDPSSGGAASLEVGPVRSARRN